MLRVPKAIECAHLTQYLDYYRLISCRQGARGNEIIVFDVDVERSQNTVHDIRYKERIAVDFSKSDQYCPTVFALRADFPSVPHLNLMEFEWPKCLCLYEQSYDEIKLQWRGVAFLERIREWLSLTANGKLHQDDQPLEQLILSADGIFIFPNKKIVKRQCFVKRIKENRRWIVLRALPDRGAEQKVDPFYIMLFQGAPQTHGVISKTPKNLLDLNECLKNASIPLLEKLTTEVSNLSNSRKYQNHQLLIFLVLPKKRQDESVDIEDDYFVVLTDDKIDKLGEKLGIWKQKQSRRKYEGQRADRCKIKILTPHPDFNPRIGALSNNIEPPQEIKITMIGAGALGSQIYVNLRRAGYGKWSVLDHDTLLPHNLARHALSSQQVGTNKAFSLASFGNSLCNDQNSVAFDKDFLTLRDNDDANEVLNESDLILDVSTSIPVARKLSDLDIRGRKISIFLNPTGEDLVVLSEGENEQYSLDMVEMQYYRYLIQEPSLKRHLDNLDKRTRYSNACRDISARIPQDYIAIHAGISSNAIKKIYDDARPTIGIWQITASMAVNRINTMVYPAFVHRQNQWKIVIDQFLVDKISAARANCLPNETGGILIGSFDMIRHKVYLVDTILSPTDSEEYPTAYIRGIEGVGEKLAEVGLRTANNLEYVGEWHSHPEGCSVDPSIDDKELFAWLTQNMSGQSRPAIMLIVSDRKQYQILANMSQA